VIIAQAGYFGGWTLYMKDGKPHHEYNWFAIERTNIAGDTALAAGKHTIGYEFIPDSEKPGTGGKSILSVDGKKGRRGQDSRRRSRFAFSADEGADVGLDAETNVSPDYKPNANAFHGQDPPGDRRAEVGSRRFAFAAPAAPALTTSAPGRGSQAP
jgi:arylsulfatase